MILKNWYDFFISIKIITYVLDKCEKSCNINIQDVIRILLNIEVEIDNVLLL